LISGLLNPVSHLVLDQVLNNFKIEKSIYDRMDALDEGNPAHTDNENNDGGEENVEADEREGNREYLQNKKVDSYEQENEHEADDEDENDYRTNQTHQVQPVGIEESMKRLKLTNDNNDGNYDSRLTSEYYQNAYNQPMGPDFYENQVYVNQHSPHGNFEANYQTEEYPNPNGNMTEGTENDQNAMLISQYESVLQSVNREFQKLLNKNKDTEEELSVLKDKFEQVSSAYENEANRNAQNEGMLLYFN
jgi:hypothetical protein